ncbi:antibiotic biosynthesis monooxygenase [Spongiactinospora sp. TRM90649]|uniref:antibiotic biosynthesis monooxygenase n=1 Tax=Spongiactinospora sp. TRM90649 TaxID=3031114 RepID=UPI0023F9C9BB|nr:antibiotic biosynthesis monooxygenase [Spongiactinospora sp. TRM90649]MDF5757414.1 antibiotic biosynthesis monooxygenase [Spongiactinospora sp. TRM90649]
MTVISVTRFQADPADAELVQARHADLVAAIRATRSGLTEARLGRLNKETWVGVWRWDSAADLRAARQAAAGDPAAVAAFAVAHDVMAEDIEVLAEL